MGRRLHAQTILTVSPGGCAVIGAEGAAEMGRVIEPPAETDLADRQGAMGRAGQIGTAMFQPSLPQIMAEARAGLLEELLDVARRHMLLVGNLPQREIAIAELALDGLADAMEIAGAGNIETACRRAFGEARNDEFGQRDFDGADMFVGQFLKVRDDGAQEA